jgi:hypothetical protein
VSAASAKYGPTVYDCLSAFASVLVSHLLARKPLGTHGGTTSSTVVADHHPWPFSLLQSCREGGADQPHKNRGCESSGRNPDGHLTPALQLPA